MTPPAYDIPEETFERLGRITRNLHEAMTQLGLDQSLHAIAQEFPDARDRLSHVGHMTETAATKVKGMLEDYVEGHSNQAPVPRSTNRCQEVSVR